MQQGLFQFIWKYSKTQQLIIMVMTAAYMPFLYFALELPKYIVNDAIDGSEFPRAVFGIDLGQVDYLLFLCTILLFLLIAMAVANMMINTYKGVAAERMLRRLRYQLYERILLFPHHHFQKVTPSELSSMLTAEVEPLGDFIRDSFAMPMVQGGTMLTILFFMMSEDPLLGLVAISMVPVQAWLIPKLQKKVNLLGRERVTRARHLAGRVGESVLGIGDVHVNDASGYMRADVAERLGGIFWVREELFRRKFFMKSLNTFLSQLTPLFFYSVGGYLIIQGDLSLGALVAVLAAYARFTTPWRELLKYYQRLNDAMIKYEQLIEQFQPDGMMDAAIQQDRPDVFPDFKQAIDVHKVDVVEDGIKALDNVSLHIQPGDKVAVVADPGSRDKIAHLAARLVAPTTGSIKLGGEDLATLPEAAMGARIGYAGADSYIFGGTVADNLFLGLRHCPVLDGANDNALALAGADGDVDEAKVKRNLAEARAAGNTTDSTAAEWIDLRALGCGTKAELEDWVLQVICAVELDDQLRIRSLGMGMDGSRYPDLSRAMVGARDIIRARIKAGAQGDNLVHRFDFERYNANASVAANLVFGEPVGDEFDFETLAAHPYVREVLVAQGLDKRFLFVGARLAETLVELFGDLTGDQPLFERFSFVDEDILHELKGVAAHVQRSGEDSLAQEQKDLLISLALKLTVDKHRLGLVGYELQEQIIQARKAFRTGLPDEKQGAIAFFDQEDFNSQLSNRCNLIMGRVNHTIANAEKRVNEILFDGLDELGLTQKMILYATEDPVGVGGAKLSQANRQKLALARALLKRPDILIYNDALNALDRESQLRIRTNVRALLPDATMLSIFGEEPEAEDYDQTIIIRDGRIEARVIDQQLVRDEADDVEPAAPEDVTAAAEGGDDGDNLDAEARALAKVPMFAGIRPKSLKLLAFSSRRVQFKPGDVLIRQGEPGVDAYVILTGSADVVLGDGADEQVIAERGRFQLLGELSLLSDTVTTATIRAKSEIAALQITKETFLQIMESDAKVAAQVARVVSDKLVSSLQTANDTANDESE